MSLELGLTIFAILMIGILGETIVDCRSFNTIIRRIQDVEKDNELQKKRIAGLESVVQELGEWKDDFKKEIIQRRRVIDWLKAQVAKLQAEKKETPEEKEAENGE